MYDDANSNDIEEDKGNTWNISSLFFGIVIEFNSLEDDATVKSENSFSLSVNEPNPPEMAKFSNYAISSGITFVCARLLLSLSRANIFRLNESWATETISQLKHLFQG